MFVWYQLNLFDKFWSTLMHELNTLFTLELITSASSFSLCFFFQICRSEFARWNRSTWIYIFSTPYHISIHVLPWLWPVSQNDLIRKGKTFSALHPSQAHRRDTFFVSVCVINNPNKTPVAVGNRLTSTKRILFFVPGLWCYSEHSFWQDGMISLGFEVCFWRRKSIGFVSSSRILHENVTCST